MNKLKTIIAWLLLIVFSPLILFICLITMCFKFLDGVVGEMQGIFDYQITPYVRWKYRDVRKRFGKKDSN